MLVQNLSTEKLCPPAISPLGGLLWVRVVRQQQTGILEKITGPAACLQDATDVLSQLLLAELGVRRQETV